VLTAVNWAEANVADVAAGVLGTFDGDGRIAAAGPDVTLGPRGTLSLSLLLHELATNAVKHGALSVPDGRVDLTWQVADGDGGPAAHMRWSERGGPPAVVPERRGFGSRIIRMGLSGSGGTDIRYGTEGLTVEMTATLAQLRQA